MVAVVDAPAGEVAVRDGRLIPRASQVVHPDLPRPSLTVRASGTTNGVCETKHPAGRHKEVDVTVMAS